MIRRLFALAASALTGMVAFATVPAFAATVWTDWTSATSGEPGSASGTLNGVTVTYAGELDSAVTDGSSVIWAPDSSFMGGTVTTSPSNVKDAILLNGTFALTCTITFASPILNPVFASGVWETWGLQRTSPSL